MHNFEQQPLQDRATTTRPREEEALVTPIERPDNEPPSAKARQVPIWRYILPAGTILLILAIIFANLLLTKRQTRIPPTNKQPAHIVAPVSQPFSIPTAAATPLQTSGASQKYLITSLAGGVAYVGTSNNAVYALNMNSGTVRWQQHIDGAVSQQPLVLNGVIYINSYAGENGPDYTYALQADNGTVLWRSTSSGYTYLSSATGISNALYLVSTKGVSALQTSNGRTLWYFATKGSGDNMPIIDNGVVYATSFVESGSGTLYALRASDGKLLWQHTEGSYIAVSFISNNVVYFTGSRAIAALQVKNGKALWRRTIDADIIQPPQLVNGILYTTGLKTIIALVPRVTALGELIGTNPTRPTLPLKGGAASIYAIQANNGAVIWHSPLLNGEESWVNWLSVQNGTVYIGISALTSGANKGEIYALKSQNGAVIWHDIIRASPNNALLVNGTIYLNANNESETSALYALKADTGALLWSYPVNGYISDTPILAGAALYIGADNGVLYALHPDNGTLLWHYQTNVGA